MELIFELVDGTIVENEIIGSGDWATFFEVFDFGLIAMIESGSVKGAVGAFGGPFVAERFRNDDGDKSDSTRVFVFKNFVFGPGVDAVEDDAALAGRD